MFGYYPRSSRWGGKRDRAASLPPVSLRIDTGAAAVGRGSPFGRPVPGSPVVCFCRVVAMCFAGGHDAGGSFGELLLLSGRLWPLVAAWGSWLSPPGSRAAGRLLRCSRLRGSLAGRSSRIMFNYTPPPPRGISLAIIRAESEKGDLPGLGVRDEHCLCRSQGACPGVRVAAGCSGS